jgi:hypothetical protein
MTVISTFPNGQQLVSSALSPQAMSTLFQQLAAQMLGVVATPFNISATLTNGHFNAFVSSTASLYVGLAVAGPGLPTFTVVIDQIISQTEIVLSSAALTTGVFVVTASDLEPYAKVRLDWPTAGAPTFLIGDDVCFVAAIEIEDNYGMIRDVEWPQNDSLSVNATYGYTRVWAVTFANYGPNSFDKARLIRSAVLLDWTHDYLAQNNVYLIPDTPSPKRVPYEFQNQWWERTDLRLRFNELVTETIVIPAGKSVEIIVETSTGIVADFTVTSP